MDLLKIDVDSIPHDALLVALLSSGLGAKAGTGYRHNLPIHRRRCQFGTSGTGFLHRPRDQVLHTEIGPWFPPPAQYWRDYASISNHLKSQNMLRLSKNIKTHFSNRLSVSFSSGKLDMLRFFQTPPIYLSAYLRLFFSFH